MFKKLQHVLMISHRYLHYMCFIKIFQWLNFQVSMLLVCIYSTELLFYLLCIPYSQNTYKPCNINFIRNNTENIYFLFLDFFFTSTHFSFCFLLVNFAWQFHGHTHIHYIQIPFPPLLSPFLPCLKPLSFL